MCKYLVSLHPDFKGKANARKSVKVRQADMRPKDLASRIDVPLEVLQACIKGKVPDAEILYRIAKGLDVTMEWLLTGEEVRLPKETIH